MDMWKIVKWVLIVIAVWWAWNWVTSNFANSSDSGPGELYNAPYAAPLVGNYPITGWSPYWYLRRGNRGPARPRRGRR